MRFWVNPESGQTTELTDVEGAVLGMAASELPCRLLASCPNYRATPMHAMDRLAGELGLASLHIKDERQRLGLNSFKALGGAFAVLNTFGETLAARLGHEPTAQDWLDAIAAKAGSNVTVTAATAGNHGLSVAAGARVIGAHCRIYVHRHVSEGRRNRLRAFGADVIESGEDFDASVRAAETAAEAEDLMLIPDTAYDPADRISGEVVRGYGVLSREIIDAWPDENQPPTHFFVQAGVGGLAAGTIAVLADYYGTNRPRIVLVEPLDAGALHASMSAGEPVRITAPDQTSMAMLACYEPSALPFHYLKRITDACVLVTDEEAETAVQTMSHPAGEDEPLPCSASAAAGLAGLIAAVNQPDVRNALQLDASSRVVLICSEAVHPDA